MKLLNRILTLLITMIFLTLPVLADDNGNKVNTNGLVLGAGSAMHNGVDGERLLPQAHNAKPLGLEVDLGGGGLYPPKPKSIETRQSCILNLCLL